MSDPVKQAWDEVGDGFSSLRRLMRDRISSSDSGSEPTEQEHDKSEAALRAALESVVTAAREFGERAADIVKDPEVKAQTKQALSSLNSALSATADQVGDDLRGLFKRAKSSGTGSAAGEPHGSMDPADAPPTPEG